MKEWTQIDLFRAIWNSRKHESFLSKKPLKYFNVASFAHVLPKGRYPSFKLKEFNIVLLTATEHTLLDQGTETQRKKYGQEHGCDWQKLYDYRTKLNNMYKSNIKYNVNPSLEMDFKTTINEMTKIPIEEIEAFSWSSQFEDEIEVKVNFTFKYKGQEYAHGFHNLIELREWLNEVL